MDRASEVARGSRREDYSRVRTTTVFLAAAHLDHDPANNRPRNLKALCQRCHLLLDWPRHRLQARLTILRRRAAGDLFLGVYARTRLDALAPVLRSGAMKRPPDEAA